MYSEDDNTGDVDDEAMDVDSVPVSKSDSDDLTKYNLENYDEDTQPLGEFSPIYLIVLAHIFFKHSGSSAISKVSCITRIILKTLSSP